MNDEITINESKDRIRQKIIEHDYREFKHHFKKVKGHIEQIEYHICNMGVKYDEAGEKELSEFCQSIIIIVQCLNDALASMGNHM